jgi:hypothetical protein
MLTPAEMKLKLHVKTKQTTTTSRQKNKQQQQKPGRFLFHKKGAILTLLVISISVTLRFTQN